MRLMQDKELDQLYGVKAKASEVAVRSTAKQEVSPFPSALVDLSQWVDKAPPPREWLVKDLIPKGAVTGLFGQGGVGKSLLCQQLATTLALGKDTFGEVPKAYKVMGVFCEDDQDELSRRQRDICDHHGVSVADVLVNLSLYSFAYEPSFIGSIRNGVFTSNPFFEHLKNEIMRIQPDLVILDNISRLLAGSKTDEAGVYQFLSYVGLLAANRAVLLVGHTGKADDEGKTTEYFGSVAFNNGVRQRLFLEVKGKDVLLSARKGNYTKADYEKYLAYKEGAFEVISKERRANEKKLDNDTKLDRAKEAILSFISGQAEKGHYYKGAYNSPNFVVTKMIALDDPRVTKGLDKDTLKKAVERLVNDNVIGEVSVGKDPATRKEKVGLVIKSAQSG